MIKLKKVNRKNMALNKSPSKLKFSFGKDQRFKEVRTYNQLSAYDLKDQFKKDPNYRTIDDDQQKAFGSSLPDRFYYLGN